MDTCPHCNGVIDEDDHECPHCGKEAQPLMDEPAPEPGEDERLSDEGTGTEELKEGDYE